MNISDLPAGSVVVGYDGSPDADLALDWAATRAAAEHRPLAVVHSVAPHVSWGGTGVEYAYLLEATRDDTARLLDDARRRLHAIDPELDPVVVDVTRDARDALVAASDEAALVVVGSRGRGGFARLLMGSVSSAVSVHARCPVVVVRAGDASSRTGVVVAVGGTRRSVPVIEFAFREAALMRLPLMVVHAVGAERDERDESDSRTEQRLLLAEAVAGFAEKFPDVQTTLESEPGLVGRVLAEQAESADLLVVGHHHRRWTPHLRPSIAVAVLEHATGPVAVVPEGTGR